MYDVCTVLYMSKVASLSVKIHGCHERRQASAGNSIFDEPHMSLTHTIPMIV
jgi:hypothetical protein